MKILALEFSSSQRSVAVIAEAAKGGSRHAAEIVAAGSESSSTLSLVDEALRQSGHEREEIDCIAIGLGPGSYTGVRAAIARAQGWQLANGVKLRGISSADCIAATARAEGMSGSIRVVIDAQRDEFYLARYELTEVNWDETEKLRLATRAEVLGFARAGESLVGPEVTRWFPGGRVIFPRAVALGQLAAQRDGCLSSERPEPIYLRETSFVKAALRKVNL